MGIYNVHAGHCPQGQGASGAGGIFYESIENRKVKDAVIEGLKGLGHTVHDCTVNYATSKNGCLNAIVAMCNAHNVDLDISIHFNASTGAGHGVEVLCYDTGTQDVAQSICNTISALGFRNRGVKYRRDLCVLNSTKAPAILIECCFCDNQADANIYNANTMAQAIVKGITGQAASGDVPSAPEQPAPQPTPTPSTNIDIDYAVMIEGGKTLPVVRGTSDYAGIAGKRIVGFMCRPTDGTIKYRVHLKGKGWLGWVTGFNWNDYNNGFAGDGVTPIDAIEVYLYSPNNDKYVYYRVSPLNSNYYSYQRDNDKGNGMDGYAGAFGKEIDRIQIYVS